jgi:membrane-associated phospholipid phosphatase
MHLGPGLARAAEDQEAGAPAPAEVADPEPHPQLTMDITTHAWLTGGMLAVVGVSQYYSDKLMPPTCKWCNPPQVDIWTRDQLVWSNTKAAANSGNLMLVVVPTVAVVTLGVMNHADGLKGRQFAEDVLIVTESATITMLLMHVAKYSTARTRPDAWAGSGSTTANSRMSFYAGHSANLFAVGAAAMQVARMRGHKGWGWLGAACFVGATVAGYSRIASDNHWLTDVLAGAAVGTSVGLAVPVMVLHPAEAHSSGVTLVPAPGGLALLF